MSGINGHHVINRANWTLFAKPLNALGLGLNDPQNMVDLPTASNDWQVAIHPGGHLAVYYVGVRESLTIILGQPNVTVVICPPASNAQFAAVRMLQSDLRGGLTSYPATVYTNANPTVGLSDILANAIDSVFLLWRKTNSRVSSTARNVSLSPYPKRGWSHLGDRA